MCAGRGYRPRPWGRRISLVREAIILRVSLPQVMMVADSNSGGLIPMVPYFATRNVTHALFISIAITVISLLGFGCIKNWVTVRTKRSVAYGAIQTLCIGALAAGASYGIVKAIDITNSPGALAP